MSSNVPISNCYLHRLYAKPGKILPNFEKDQLEYNIILGATEIKTTLEIMTEDANDTYLIVHNNDPTENVIEISEGVTKLIQIIIESEYNENSRTYTIYLTRMSSKVAYLEALNIHPGKLTPNFDSHVYHYTCLVGSNVCTIKMHFELPDTRCILEVNKEPPQSSYELHFACTTFRIRVQSVDETFFKKYLIDVFRKEIPRYILISDPTKRIKYEDPVSLSPLYCPMKIGDYEIWSVMSSTYCDQMKLLQRLGSGKAIFEPKSCIIRMDKDVERKISDFQGRIPLTYGGFSYETRLSHLGGLLSKCKEPSPFKPWKLSSTSAFLDTFELSPQWQDELGAYEYEVGEKDFTNLYEETMIEYFFYLPNSPVTDNYVFPTEANPVGKLQSMITCVVNELKIFPDSSDLHLNLAFLLEEKFMLQDTMNIKFGLFRTNDLLDSNKYSSPNQSKINCICARYEFIRSPTLCQQLRTLQDEHRRLVNGLRHIEADHIQYLYDWKINEASEEGRLAMLITDERTGLGQAAYKYGTALYLDNHSYIKNFQVARMLVLEGKYGEAIIRIENSLTLNHSHLPSKFLLGFTLSKLRKITDQKRERAIELLLDGMEFAMTQFSLNSVIGVETRKVSKRLMADDENFFRLENPLICRGFLSLGRMLLKRQTSNNFIKPIHIFHTTLVVAAMGWSRVSSGCLMVQFEFVIIQCHKELLNLLSEEVKDVSKDYTVKRCEWLNAFISSSMVPLSEKIIEIQEQACQQLVFHQPCNEYYLINLGMVFIKKAEMFRPKSPMFAEHIESAIRILKIAVEMNCKPMTGPAVPYLNDLQWFKVLRANYLTTRAPLIIAEALKMIETEEQKALRNPSMRYSSLKDKSESKMLSNMSPKDSFSSMLGKTKSKSGHKHQTVPKSFSSKKESSTNPRKKKSHGEIVKNNSIMSTKRFVVGDRSSLFTFCHSDEDLKKKKLFLKTHYSPDGALLNPPTLYSRLIIARAYRANYQYVDSVKCYNFIRKITLLPGLKSLITREMIEVLLEGENFDQALETMSKINMNENRITPDDIFMCKKIVELILKMGLFDDERIFKYCLILMRFDDKNSLRDMLLLNKLENVYLKLVEAHSHETR